MSLKSVYVCDCCGTMQENPYATYGVVLVGTVQMRVTRGKTNKGVTRETGQVDLSAETFCSVNCFLQHVGNLLNAEVRDVSQRVVPMPEEAERKIEVLELEAEEESTRW